MMNRSSIRRYALTTCAFAICALSGCAVSSDLLNPDLLSGLGFDPNTIAPPSGYMVVVFTNSTDQLVEMRAYVAEDADDLSVGTATIRREVLPGDQAQAPVECPFALLSPGGVAGGAADTVAAVVGIDTGQGTDVNYPGGPLVAGFDIFCGDVIEIELFDVGGGGNQQAANVQYGFRVRRIPGR
jgi:hypothetical protein